MRFVMMKMKKKIIDGGDDDDGDGGDHCDIDEDDGLTCSSACQKAQCQSIC